MKPLQRAFNTNSWRIAAVVLLVFGVQNRVVKDAQSPSFIAAEFGAAGGPVVAGPNMQAYAARPAARTRDAD